MTTSNASADNSLRTPSPFRKVLPAEQVDDTILQSNANTLVLVMREIHEEPIDWSMLGLLMGLTDAEMQRCQTEPNLNKAHVQQWLNKGEASWAILVAALRDDLVNKVPLGNAIAKKHPKVQQPLRSPLVRANLTRIDQPKITVTREISVTDPPIVIPDDETEVTQLKQSIENWINIYESTAQGIIYVVGVHGANGTHKDVQRVTETFKKLQFAVYHKRDITSASIIQLIKAAVKCNYPEQYKFAAFYFAGHGGRNESGEAYIKGFENHEIQAEPVLIEQSIVIPWQNMRPDITRLFFFDCCQTQFTQSHNILNPMKVPASASNQVIAYATSNGQRSIGDRENGGIWTKHLCENISKKLSIVEVLAETYENVKSVRSDFQSPMTVSSVGAISLHKDYKKPTAPTTSTSGDPEVGGSAVATGPPEARLSARGHIDASIKQIVTSGQSFSLLFQSLAEKRPYLAITCLTLLCITFFLMLFVWLKDNALFNGALLMSLAETHPGALLGIFITVAVTVCVLALIRILGMRIQQKPKAS